MRVSIINKSILGFLFAVYCSTGFAILPTHITTTVKSNNIIESAIVVKTPDIAENGSVVSVSIKELKLPPGTYVTKLWFFDHYRQDPLAVFDLKPQASAKYLTTRVKLAKTSTVYAIALLSDGSYISGRSMVKITIGGCGGGGSYDNYAQPQYHQSSRQGTRSHNYQSAIRYQNQSIANTERYAKINNNGVVSCAEQPLSTFSIDVDTGSYSNVRRFLIQQGRLPVVDAVRVEEMINYFDYDYPVPNKKETPFSITTEVGPSPWNKHRHLLHIGLKGYEADVDTLPPANLVFLVDVSGSMQSENKLDLLKSSLKTLSRQLREQDRISIVTYAGRTGVVLEPTSGIQQQKILNSLNQLQAGGSTNGGAGIQLAYDMAERGYIKDGINRVILATDGDFNVGLVNHAALIELIKKYRKTGISLTTLGFGTGNYNEKLMEQLADHGNGNYAYIDNFREAKKVLVEQISGTLFTIAKDVKIQIEFNPAVVAEYRLIGYENRLLQNKDFRNDKVDAGDIGAGHTVTALYEISFVGSPDLRTKPLRYSTETKPVQQKEKRTDEVAMVQLRYKLPDATRSIETHRIIQSNDVINDLNNTSNAYRFSAAVAALGQWLTNHEEIADISIEKIKDIASSASQPDPKGYRSEFISLIDVARELKR